jgi:hypothetical protein
MIAFANSKLRNQSFSKAPTFQMFSSLSRDLFTIKDMVRVRDRDETVENSDYLILLTLFMRLVDDNATAIQFLEAPEVSKETFEKVIESPIAGEVLKPLVMMPFVVISYNGENRLQRYGIGLD